MFLTRLYTVSGCSVHLQAARNSPTSPVRRNPGEKREIWEHRLSRSRHRVGDEEGDKNVPPPRVHSSLEGLLAAGAFDGHFHFISRSFLWIRFVQNSLQASTPRSFPARFRFVSTSFPPVLSSRFRVPTNTMEVTVRICQCLNGRLSIRKGLSPMGPPVLRGHDWMEVWPDRRRTFLL